MLDFYRQFAAALQKGPVVLATVTHAKGSVPREVGAMMVVRADRSLIGTIGGGAGEAKIICHARQVLITGIKQLVAIDLSGTPLHETQGVCGGLMQVWLERWDGAAAIVLVAKIITVLQAGQSGYLILPLVPERSPYVALTDHTPLLPVLAFPAVPIPLLAPPTLLIVGAGHVALSLVHMASLIDFQIMVQDDRPEFANVQRFPDATAVLTQPLEATVQRLATVPQLYAALVTRSYQYDVAALKVLLPRSLRYIGMIGSKKRVKTVFQMLQREGIPGIDASRLLSLLESIHAPIGLDIGALTPAEIAVSICAELISVRQSGREQSPCIRSPQSVAQPLHNGLLPVQRYGQQQAQQQ